MSSAKKVTPVGPKCIAGGFFHSLALGYETNAESQTDVTPEEVEGLGGRRKVQVYAFGSNRHHALGIGCPFECDICQNEIPTPSARGSRHSFEKPSLVQALKDTSIYQVSCGGSHSVFLEMRDGQLGGRVWASGLGQKGRLGVERSANQIECGQFLRAQGYKSEDAEVWAEQVMSSSQWSFPRPVLVSFPANILITYVACGMDHTLAVGSLGAVWAWGVGSYGNLGDGSTDDRWAPVRAHLPDGVACFLAAAGSKHSLALSDDGGLYSWGFGGNGRLGQGSVREGILTPMPISSLGAAKMSWIAASDSHSASVDVLGNVWTWGAASYGRCGHSEEIDLPAPKMLAPFSSCACSCVELGSLHTLALDIDGMVYAWGSGSATGVLDIVGSDTQWSPKPVGLALSEMPVLQIAAGSFHSLALQQGGKIFAWGTASQGRLGGELGVSDQRRPTQIHSVKGWMSQCAVLECDGTNDTESQRKERRSKRDPAEGLLGALDGGRSSDIIAVCSGGMHSAALSRKGDLYCWGSNEFGQIGNASAEDALEPTCILLRNKKVRITAIALGLEHCLALTSASTVLSWGRNQEGQLGLGKRIDQRFPEPIIGLEQVASISAGEDHSAASTMMGSLLTWGSAAGGKLGHGKLRGKGCMDSPRVVAHDDFAVMVHCGQQHTAMIDRQGNLSTFGTGWFGRLGHGDMANKYFPTQVQSLRMVSDEGIETRESIPIADVQCALYHTVALSQDRRLWRCGRDLNVSAGDHLVEFTLLELQEPSDGKLAVVRTITASAQHTFVVSEKGTLWAWGDNKSDQLGLGSGAARDVSEPTVVPPKPWKSRGERIVSIATSHGHSLALSDQCSVYVWGLQCGGRLGLPQEGSGKRQVKPRRLHAFKTGRANKRMFEVNLIAKHESDISATSAFVELAEPAESMVSLAVMADQLRHHYTRLTEALRKDSDELSERCREYLEDLFDLWKKPESINTTQVLEEAACEWMVRRLREDLDVLVCKSLRHMGLDGQYPNLSNSRVHPFLVDRLVYYEELVFLLQQQPCYLTRLAAKLLYVSEEEDSKPLSGLVERIAGRIFKDFDSSRIRHLFMAFLRSLMIEEIKAIADSQKNETSFRRIKSIASGLLQDAISNVYFKDFRGSLFDSGNQKSLIVLVEMWTNSYANESDFNNPMDEHIIPETLFVFHSSDLRRFENVEEAEVRLVEHQTSFARFLGNTVSGPNTFASFMERFQFPSIFDSIWKVFHHVVARFKDMNASDLLSRHQSHSTSVSDPDVVSMLVKWFMRSVMGHILQNINGLISSQHRLALREHCVKKVRKEGFEDEKRDIRGFNASVNIKMERVLFNMKQLGVFLQRAANNQCDTMPGAREMMAKEAVACTANILTPFVQRFSSSVYDDTEVRLLTDLYQMHYDMKDHYVSLPSDDLLLLGDALWMHRDHVIGIRRQKESRLYNVLDKLQPPRQEKSGMRCWVGTEDFNDVRASAVLHNFLINHRFVEFERDVCICNVCKAPIPVALDNQAHPSEIQTILRPFVPLQGLEIDGEHPFAVLRDAFAHKEFPDLRSTTFEEAVDELHEQKLKTWKMFEERGPKFTLKAPDMELLEMIGTSRNTIVQLLKKGYSLSSFAQFFDESLEQQKKHVTFLDTVRRRLDLVKDWRAAYSSKLRVVVMSLQSALMHGSNYVVPPVIRSEATLYGVSLKFTELERTNKAEKASQSSGIFGGVDQATSATYSLASLCRKKVIKRFGGDEHSVPREEYRWIRFNFECRETKDWHVTVTRRKAADEITMLCTFEIHAREVEQMKGVSKNTARTYNDGFVKFDCFNLLQLLTRILALPA